MGNWSRLRLDMAEAVLRERNGQPMHYRELADEVMRRGATEPVSGYSLA